MLQIDHEMGQEICVIFAVDGCPEQFHIVKKNTPYTKHRRTLGACEDFICDLCAENDISNAVKRQKLWQN
jgi:hypothetical protein